MADEQNGASTGLTTPYPDATIVDCGIDYITATATNSVKREALRELGYALFADERSRDNDPKPFHTFGYMGLSCGGVTYADRDDGTLIRLSGDLARQHWREVGAHAEHCSRLDLQVTARFERPALDVAHLGYITAAGYKASRGADLKVSIIIVHGEGGTLNLGSRSSELYGRLYDKQAESKDAAYRNCWRWEVETKRERSDLTLRLLLRQEETDETVQATVYSYYVERGVAVPWTVGVSRGLPHAPTRQSDDERRLQWLSHQVAPVVGKLRARMDVSRIVKAVGLNDLTYRS